MDLVELTIYVPVDLDRRMETAAKCCGMSKESLASLWLRAAAWERMSDAEMRKTP
jgi:hypothetical protein